MKSFSSIIKKNYITNIEQLKESIQSINEASNTKKDGKYFFNKILFFTNERDSKHNKTLKNLEEAILGENH